MFESRVERGQYTKIGDIAVYIGRLTEQAARFWSEELLAIHNLIPYVSWQEEDLLNEGPDGSRWETGLVAIAESAVGLCVSYRRPPAPQPPFDFESIYIHRLAVKQNAQRHRIGHALIAEAGVAGLTRHPDLDYVSLQTNDEPSNEPTIAFYEGLGFEKRGHIHYPDKVDWLMRIHRSRIEETWGDLVPELGGWQNVPPEAWTHFMLQLARYRIHYAEQKRIEEAGDAQAYMRSKPKKPRRHSAPSVVFDYNPKRVYHD